MARSIPLLAPAAWLAMAAATAAAAPPPPALVPEELRQPIDGYDLQTPYQLWHMWVEAQKGAATEALLAQPETLPGEQPHEAPLLRFRKYNDFGHFLTGEIRAYCRPAEAGRPPRGPCHYRLRRAYVSADSAGLGGGDNPVAIWTRRSFDAARLIAHFRASGFAPDSDWWTLDRARIFAALPSAVPVLIENATLVRLDSRDCPRMARAIARLEQRRLDWRLDLAGVGADGEREHPWPHAVRSVHTLYITTPNGGSAAIEGELGALNAFVGPILDAADGCERARARTDGTP